MIEEERRLLYVAMTRARHDLHLVAPLKYYITQQPRTGDKHVYGARSRFITDELMQTLQAKSWPADQYRVAEPRAVASSVRVDAGAKLRSMWD
jgi:DNA helicase-2/ATP-dependent DNA helicase PcrA